MAPKTKRSTGNAKPKSKSTSRASRLRKPAVSPKSRSAAGTKAKRVATGTSASRVIDQRIRRSGGVAGETLARMRALVLEADPEMAEEVKWRG